MLKHLRDVVAMLRLGREIAESRLDEKLLRSVDITDFKGDHPVAGRRRAKICRSLPISWPTICMPTAAWPSACSTGWSRWLATSTTDCMGQHLGKRLSRRPIPTRSWAWWRQRPRRCCSAAWPCWTAWRNSSCSNSTEESRQQSTTSSSTTTRKSSRAIGPDRRQERLPAPGLHSHQLGRQRAGAQAGDGDALRHQWIHAEHARL